MGGRLFSESPLSDRGVLGDDLSSTSECGDERDVFPDSAPLISIIMFMVGFTSRGELRGSSHESS